LSRRTNRVVREHVRAGDSKGKNAVRGERRAREGSIILRTEKKIVPGEMERYAEKTKRVSGGRS